MNSQTNLRTKINPTIGKIIKGTLNDAEVKLTTSSIPTKKQSVIIRNPTVSAFGSSVHRFSNKSYDQPGPAEYTGLSRPYSNPSFSKKGYGPLLSKFDRIATKRNLGPGPGQYNKIQTKIFKNNSSIIFPKQNRQDLFKDQIRRAEICPGPGNYNYKQNNNKSSTFMFKSNIPKLQTINNETPPSTKYQIKSKLFQGRTFSIKKPNPIMTKQNMLNNFFGNQKSLLGPGTYNVDINSKKNKQSYSIREGARDRFGQLKKQQILRLKKSIVIPPGPGTYRYQNEPSWKHKRDFKNIFESRTDRKVFEGQRQGPQFYEYNTNKKSIVSLNPSSKWI